MYWVFSSFDGQDDESTFELLDEAASDGFPSSLKVNGGEGQLKTVPRQLPRWLSNSTPNEFVVWLKDCLLHNGRDILFSDFNLSEFFFPEVFII